jgi:hypothetical protein
MCISSYTECERWKYVLHGVDVSREPFHTFASSKLRSADFSRFIFDVKQVWNYLEPGEIKTNPKASDYFVYPIDDDRGGESACGSSGGEKAKANGRKGDGSKKPKHETISDGLRRAIQFYSTLQTDDGHWSGDYGGPMFLLPVRLRAHPKVPCWVSNWWGWLLLELVVDANPPHRNVLLAHSTSIPYVLSTYAHLPNTSRLQFVSKLTNLLPEHAFAGGHVADCPRGVLLALDAWCLTRCAWCVGIGNA